MKNVKKSANEIRKMFLDFFYKNGHEIVPSSPIIPKDEDHSTLLFNNAGMNQFKNIFLGLEKSNYSRVVTSQYCIRAGGKHNDLENVGYTVQHHTFFEMLGNFSFGDYFKQEAIEYAWELLTSKIWFNLPKDRFLVTVYESDHESYEIWKKKIGIKKERIIRIGDNKGIKYFSDNFWQMEDIGPCGPCTEIFYDRGKHIEGNLPGSKNQKKNSRYIEIWNLVFIQFNRKIDGSIEPLSNPSVDTGMGLERITAVLQNVNSNYDTDLFQNLVLSIAKIIGTNDLKNKSLYVIADHIRSCSFLIANGVIPSNENRGYVLRRIIRRAIRHCNILLGKKKEIFFYKLVSPLIKERDSIGEKLRNHQKKIEKILKSEEEQFFSTLEKGLTLLNQKLKKFSGDTLDGKIAFHLYDTYGFPIDLTIDICREYDIKVDRTNFDILMEEQRIRSRNSKKNYKNCQKINFSLNNFSKFEGYECLETNSKVISIFVDGEKTNKINTGEEAIIILDKTPFYAESGGQIGDQGELKGDDFIFLVNDTQKYHRTIGQIGKLISGTLKVGSFVKAIVDKTKRSYICLNHSATHLMYSALRNILGIHILQKGFLVNDKMLRFDFSHSKKVSLSEIKEIEDLVNKKIRDNLIIKSDILDFETAKKKGALTLIDKEYSKFVRVLNIGNFSIELCKGTHASRTGDIGLFRIISESSISSGVRRIKAITGKNAIDNLHIQNDQIQNIAKLLKNDVKNLYSRLNSLLKRTHHIEKEVKNTKKE